MTEQQSMGKIQKTRSPMLPACCVVCKRAATGLIDFLDFAVDLEYYGAILICEDCAREMVTLLGYVPVAEVTSRNEQILNLTIMGRELKVENDGVRAALDSVLAVRPDLRSDDNRTDGVDSTESESATVGGKIKK